MTGYRTLLRPSRTEILIQKSRFIGEASPVENEESAMEFLRNARQTYPDASHHCYAYIIGSNMGIMRYSDDGEPGGTAGLPIMEVLRRGKICNCVAVVTRYFGGILLGTGGLHRAYTQSCAEAVRASGTGIMEETDSLLCETPYSLWDKVRHALSSLPVRLVHSEYSSSVTFTLEVRSRDTEMVTRELTRISNAQILILPDRTEYVIWETAPEEA